MTTTKATVTVEGKIYIKTTYQARETARLIPGRRWDASRKAWAAPATSSVALEIVRLFGADNLDTDDAFIRLLSQAAAVEQAQEHKDADNLAQPPLRKMDAWRHQLQAYHFAMTVPAVLLDMGLGTGKTKVAIDVIVNSGARRVLVACPKSVVPVWQKEVAKHAGIENIAVFSDMKRSCAERARRMKQFFEDCDRLGNVAVVVCNHEAAWRDEIAKVIFAAGLDIAIVDESHRIKSPSGKASRFFARLGDAVPKRMCLTGTPTPHSPLDIYGQYRFLDKGIFGTSFTMFRARYAIMGGYGGHEVKGYQRADELRAKVERISYRVGREVLDLPEAAHTDRIVELSDKTRRAYRQMEKEFYADVADGRVTAANALSKLLRLQQITSGYLPMGEDGAVAKVGNEKQGALKEVLEDMGADAGDPVVVFAKFRHDLDQIREAAEATGRTYAELSGRKNELAAWQDGGADVLGVQIQAGGAGIDLTRARYCVYYSVGYSLGDYEQSLARVHRPGQDRPVTYVHIIAEDTVDEKVYSALSQRRNVIDAIFYGEESAGK